jgi:hypothetical protein
MSGASNTKRTNPRRKGGLAAQSKKKKTPYRKKGKGRRSGGVGEGKNRQTAEKPESRRSL